jgi:hypothetical protein
MKHQPKKPVTENEQQANEAPSIEADTQALGLGVVPPEANVRAQLSSEDAQLFTDADIEELRRVLRAETRRRDTEREASRPRAGSKVRILRGRPKYVGKIGTAVIVRRSRCFVSVPELTSPAYVLVTDLELLER